MIVAMIVLLAAAVLAAGILFEHRRELTFVAAVLTLWEAQWLLLTLVDRTLLRSVETGIVFIVGSLLLLLPGLLLVKRWRWPKCVEGIVRSDLSIVLVLAVVLVAAGSIAMFNGWQDGAWVTHGFFNGDTMTWAALTEQALLTDGLVEVNPFAGNGPLEYPTLVAAGTATLLTSFGVADDWFGLWPLFTYLQIIATVPLLWLVWDTVQSKSSRTYPWWLVTGLIAYVLFASWDSYVYPQSHFFIGGLFLLLAALLTRANQLKGSARHWLTVVASGLALVLLFANAVTGTAAVATIVAWYGLRALARGSTSKERLVYGLGIVAWPLLFLLFTPGAPSFGVPGFSYTATGDMIRLAGVLLPLLIAAVLVRREHSFVATAVAVLSALAIFTFIFSTRNIVVENASRFFYHALLIGFPLLASMLAEAQTWWRKVWVATKATIVERVVTVGLVGSVGLIVLFPAAASVASAHDNLMFNDRQEVRKGMFEALQWLRLNTLPDTVVLTSSEAPFAVPLFTGRAMLRANYWLSPGDQLEQRVVDAFAGDQLAQDTVVVEASFVLLTREELPQWNVTGLNEVFSNASTVILAR